MAWFWNANKKTKREIHSVVRRGRSNSPMLEVTFKGHGPDGCREVRYVNIKGKEDPMILKAIRNWMDEEYRNRLIYNMEYLQKRNYKWPKNHRFIMLNRETLETYFCDFDTFIKHVKNFK